MEELEIQVGLPLLMQLVEEEEQVRQLLQLQDQPLEQAEQDQQLVFQEVQ